jgi:outer membrane protein OmpA-like peptidoglycan-associated protein
MRRNKGEQTDYWMSYADLMTGVLMVFILLFTYEMLNISQILEKQKPPIEKKEVKRELRKEIIEELKAAFSRENKSIDIDPSTGAVRIESEFLFPNNERKLGEKQQKEIDQLADIFLSVLSRPEFFDGISEIAIEGHTDFRGGDAYNMKLSQDRAMSVYEYLFELSPKQTNAVRLKVKSKMVTFAWGYHKPLKIGNLDYSKYVLQPERAPKDIPKLRRIEFLFRLKQDDLFIEVKEALTN